MSREVRRWTRLDIELGVLQIAPYSLGVRMRGVAGKDLVLDGRECGLVIA